MKKLLKFGCLGFVALFIIVLIIGIIGTSSFKDTTNPVSTDESTSQKTDSNNEEQDSVGIGEETKVGNVTFKVNSIEQVNEISAASGYMKYTPEADGAVFLIVNVTVRNDGKDMINTDSSFFKLKAEGGVEYSPSTVLVADDKFFNFEGINPELSLTGNVVFEVPNGLTGLKLQVQTGFWGSETGLIDLK